VTTEDVWRRKSDEDLLAAASRLGEYTETGQHAILAELQRRRETGLLDESITSEVLPAAVDSTGTADSNAALSHDLFRRLWRGEVSLPVAYWGWGVLGNFFWSGAFVMFTMNGPNRFAVFLVLLSLAYSVFICVAIWRSADRYMGRRIWATLARLFASMGLLRTVAALFP